MKTNNNKNANILNNSYFKWNPRLQKNTSYTENDGIDNVDVISTDIRWNIGEDDDVDNLNEFLNIKLDFLFIPCDR